MLQLGIVNPPDWLLSQLNEMGESLPVYLSRHQRGDAGDFAKWVAAINDEEYLAKDKVHSVYALKSGYALWITTEADRSVTTVLLVPPHLAEEYGIRP